MSISHYLKKWLLASLFAFFFMSHTLFAFDKAIIWGHKLHSHTHSYVHAAFYKAFQHLGYPTYWLDDQDDISKIDFSNALFLTEGQVDENIPLRMDCQYIVHNPRSNKYSALRMILLQVYTNAVLSNKDAIQIAPFIYYDLPGRCVYMPWATNLLPEEIEAMKVNLNAIKRKQKRQRDIYWIGTVGEGTFGNLTELAPFIRACKENHMNFVALGGGVSDHMHRNHIRTSYMAPTIVGEWQKRVGYIPCRIFKNISYGQFGVTNSKEVYELFKRKIVYNSDTYQLFYDAQARLKKVTVEEQLELMDFIKTHHTYLNRVQMLLDFLELVDNED